MGVDYSGSRPSASALKSSGVEFVCRYLAPQDASETWKLLTASEAHSLLAGGEHIVSNFESTGTDYRGGKSAGVLAATIGAAWHKACGGDPTAPLYFSIDEDTSGESTDPYFQGINSVIGVARTGVYGSYKVVKYLMDHGRIGKVHDGSNHYYAWQTYAWSYGAYDERCALSQDSNNRTVAGASVDIDHSHSSDYGQWGYPRGEDDGLANISQADFNKLMDGWAATANGKHALAVAVWKTDNVVGAPSRALAETPGNKAWEPGSFLDEGYDHARTIEDQNQALAAQVAELVTAVAALKSPTVDEAALAAQVEEVVKTALAAQSYDVTPKKAA